MNKCKRFLALLLVLCMMLSVVPVSAFAAEGSADISGETSEGENPPAEGNSISEEEEPASEEEEPVSEEEEPASEEEPVLAEDETVSVQEAAVNTVSASDDGPGVLAASHTDSKPADGTTTGNPFAQGTGGSNSFRIPAMVTLNDGTIVAAADARWNTTYDGGGLDTIVSYSTDNGANWNYTFANYLGDNGNTYNGSGSTAFIDPALATDGSTVYMLCDLYPYGVALNGSGNTAPSTAVGFNSYGKLLLSKDGTNYNYYLDGTVIKDSSGNEIPGYTVDAYFNITGTDGTSSNLFFSDSPYKVVRTGYLYLTKSTDDGKTWSAPTLIPNVKTTSEQVCLVGPGRGLVTYVNDEQTIIFPVYSYNGSNESQRMGFIYSSDDGATWTRSANFTGDSWSSESAVVELADGTLRFFYRNDHSRLYYADYTWGKGWGSAVNTGIATNSNTQISAISLTKTVDGKQVILVSCPTGLNEAGSNSSSASARLNGKIFVGLVNADGTMSWQDNAKISVPSVNSDNQFMYSCLTALMDEYGNETGKVAILYEDCESAWGNGYYTMSFATYDLSNYVTFDKEVNSDVFVETDENTDVTVTVTSDNTDTYEGWRMTVTDDQKVDGLTTRYAAYRIVLSDAEGTEQSVESATITLPVGSLNTARLYAFVVNADDTVKKVEGELSEDGTSYTFTADLPNTVGLAENEIPTVDITLTVGESQTVTDNTGNYESAEGNTAPDSSVASMELKGTSTPADGTATQGTTNGFDGSTVQLKDCLYTFTSTETENQYYITTEIGGTTYYVQPYSSNSGRPNVTTETAVTVSPGLSGNQVKLYGNGGSLHFYAEATNPYWNRCHDDTTGNCNVLLLYRPVASGESSSTELPGYVQISMNDIVSGNQYIIAAQSDAGDYYVLYPTSDTSSNRTQMAKVTGNATSPVATTAITFTGVAAGNTTAIVGNTKYDIVVTENPIVNTEDITLHVGESVNRTVTGGNYESSISNSDNSIAAVTGKAAPSASTEIVSGKKYLLYNTRQQATLTSTPKGNFLSLSGPMDAAGELWTINKSEDGSYTIQNSEDKYLTFGNGTASVVDTQTSLTLTYDAGKGGWRIFRTAENNTTYYLSNYGGDTLNQAGGYDGANDNGNWWYLYEVEDDDFANYETAVTITGKTEGTTKAIVGDTQYNITVEMNTVNVTLYVGERTEETIVAGDYSGEGAIAVKNPNIATVTGARDLSPSSDVMFVSGKTYLLYNTRSKKLLTSNTQGNGLLLDGTVAADGELWTITAVENGVTIQDSQGRYLNVGNRNATLSTDHVILLLVYANDTWTISDSTNTYHLNHLNGGQSVTAAGDGGAINDGGSQWLLYEVEDSNFVNVNTVVTITGESAGTTTAVAEGHTQYNIEVIRKTEIVYVPVGGTVTCADTSTSTTITVGDGSVATAELSGGKLTIHGHAIGTTTVTTDTTVYTVNVTTAPGTDVPLTIHQGSTETISVTLADGQYVKWTSADSSYVGVAGVYDAEKLVYTNAADLFGQQMTDKVGPIKVTGTIYNADGTVDSTCTWLVTVIAAAEGTHTVSRYYNVDQVENCVLYYSINGGELVQVNGSGVSIIPAEGNNPYTVIDGTWYGDMSLMFFAAPDEGYALTHLFVEASANQYYVLSDGEVSEGNEDVTKSSAWPFLDDVNPEEVYTDSNGHTYSVEEIGSLYKLGETTVYNAVRGDTKVWKKTNDLHGFRWSLLEGYVTPARLQKLYEDARALGCTGVTTITKNATNNSNTGTAANPISVCAIAQKLASLEKEVTQITNASGVDVTAAGIVKIGYTISYKVTVTVPATPAVVKYWNGDSITSGDVTDITYDNASTISYMNMVVTDSLSNYATDFSWETTTATSSTTAGGDQKIPVEYTIKLTKENFGSIVTGGTITNTASLDYNYTASYGTGSHKSSVNKVLDVTVDIPSYVVDFGLPVEIILTERTDGSGKITEGTASYGEVTPNNAGNGFIYTPKEVIQDVDYVKFTYQLTDDNGSVTSTNQYTVAIYPATTVYYEEGFATYSEGWTSAGSKGTGTQTAQVAGSSTDEYGYDAKYVEENAGPSNNTQATSSTKSDKATFSFTGTGVDIYANTATDTGKLMIRVTDSSGNAKKMLQVDTKMAAGTTDATKNQAVTGYNVPVASITGLTHGTYTVTISNISTEDGKTTVNLDGFRVYGTLAAEPDFYVTDQEDKPTFIELRDQVLAGLSVTSDGSGQTNAALPNDTTVAVVASSHVYNQDNVDDLLNNGPKNEIYLQPEQALVFEITTAREVQIGLKALNAATSYTITGKDGTQSINTSTDMFYTVLNKGTSDNQIITITNTGSGILSVTKLKVCDDPNATLGELTEDDLADALVSLGIQEDTTEPAPTDPAPTDPAPTDPAPTEPAPTDPAPTEPAPTEPAPTEPEEPVTANTDAVLTVALVDYAGKQIASVELTDNGAAGESKAFTAEEVLAAAKANVPDGYVLVDESKVTGAEVAYGETGTVTIQIGKTATLTITYVTLLGKKVGSATITKVQTADGDCKFSSSEINGSAPSGRRALRLTSVSVPYGSEKSVTVPVF